MSKTDKTMLDDAALEAYDETMELQGVTFHVQCDNAASLNNLGPGLGEVAAGFMTVSDPAKWIDQSQRPQQQGLSRT